MLPTTCLNLSKEKRPANPMITKKSCTHLPQPITVYLYEFFKAGSLVPHPLFLHYPGWASQSPFAFLKIRRRSSIANFFIYTLTDTPNSVKKSKSLFRSNFELPTVRLLNFVMTHGKRGLVWQGWSKAIRKLSRHCEISSQSLDFDAHWYFLYMLNGALASEWVTRPQNFKLVETEDLSVNGQIFKNQRLYDVNFSTNLCLLRKLRTIVPLFTFFIKKNDKMKIKHSRGKVEKFKVLWKYVPPYKRLYQSMKWLFKDLRFQKSKHFYVRFFTTIRAFFLNPKVSFLARIKSFVHNFVFKKHYRTLLKTLKTTV